MTGEPDAGVGTTEERPPEPTCGHPNHGGPDHACGPFLPPPEVGQIRTWRDRIGYVHQGRVQSVRIEDRECTMATAGGGIARVPFDAFLPMPDTTEADKAAREAAAARARAWLDTTLRTRVESAVVDAVEALAAIEPDTERDELKLRACAEVGKVLGDLTDRLAAHIAKGQTK